MDSNRPLNGNAEDSMSHLTPQQQPAHDTGGDPSSMLQDIEEVQVQAPSMATQPYPQQPVNMVMSAGHVQPMNVPPLQQTPYATQNQIAPIMQVGAAAPQKIEQSGDPELKCHFSECQNEGTTKCKWHFASFCGIYQYNGGCEKRYCPQHGYLQMTRRADGTKLRGPYGWRCCLECCENMKKGYRCYGISESVRLLMLILLISVVFNTLGLLFRADSSDDDSNYYSSSGNQAVQNQGESDSGSYFQSQDSQTSQSSQDSQADQNRPCPTNELTGLDCNGEVDEEMAIYKYSESDNRTYKYTVAYGIETCQGRGEYIMEKVSTPDGPDYYNYSWASKGFRTGTDDSNLSYYAASVDCDF